MSYQEPPINPFESPEPQKKGGMGTTTKVVLIVVAVLGVCTLVCCGGFVLLVRGFMNNVTDEPVEIERIAQGIIDFDVPDGFRPVSGVEFEVAGQGMQMAVYGQGDAEILMVMGISVKFNAEEFDISQSMKQNPQSNKKRIQADERETVSVMINGQECNFEIVSGTNEDEQPATEIAGGFPMENGNTGMIFIQTSAETMSVEDARAFVESIGDTGEEVPTDSIGDDAATENAMEDASRYSSDVSNEDTSENSTSTETPVEDPCQGATP